MLLISKTQTEVTHYTYRLAKREPSGQPVETVEKWALSHCSVGERKLSELFT